jgi:hypothetical protein
MLEHSSIAPKLEQLRLFLVLVLVEVSELVALVLEEALALEPVVVFELVVLVLVVEVLLPEVLIQIV